MRVEIDFEETRTLKKIKNQQHRKYRIMGVFGVAQFSLVLLISWFLSLAIINPKGGA